MRLQPLVLPLACITLLWLGGCATQEQKAERAAAKERAQTAWWLKKEFSPQGTQVSNHPLNEFGVNWRAAQALTPAYLKRQLSRSEYDDVLRSEQKFQLTTSIDGDAAQESFVVGTYQHTDAGQGRFLAILSDGEVEQVFEYPGELGFSALLQDGDSVRWFKCMACDDFDSITWNGSEYVLEPGAGEFVEAGA